MRKTLFKIKLSLLNDLCCVRCLMPVSAFLSLCNWTLIKRSHGDYRCHLCCLKMFDCCGDSCLVTWLNRSEVMNERQCADGCFFWYCVFLQESLRGRPKEIPHNEKLLSLKYEVKLVDLFGSQSTAFGCTMTPREWVEGQGYFSGCIYIPN